MTAERPCARLPLWSTSPSLRLRIEGAMEMRLKHALKALGLTFFAALALMAISAAGASATAGKLLILNAAQTVLSELAAELTGSLDLLGVLDVPSINLEIECSAFTVQLGDYLVGGTGHVKLLYSGCLVYGTNPSLVAIGGGCTIYPTAADRTAETNKGHITAEALLLVLNHTGVDGSKVVVNVDPAGPVVEGTPIFTKIFFKNCSAASADIRGGFTLLLHTSGHQLKHLFQEATGTFKLNQLKWGLNNANILGGAWVELTGAHAGRHWGLC